MRLELIPQPQKLYARAGRFRIPRAGFIGIADAAFLPAAEAARAALPRHRIAGISPRVGCALAIRQDTRLKPGGYRLNIGHRGIGLIASSPAAAFHGVQTLLQIAAQSPRGVLPELRIEDWPDFPDRGVYYDVTRGRVPKLERLMEQVELLSHYKINQFQMYLEHTFAYHGHPAIGRGASPLTAEDILKLDAFCRGRYVELVPSLATFGHLANVLTLPPYRHLAEDWGVGRYVSPEADRLPAWQRRRGWSLAPANPAIYDFLDSQFAEFLPLFTSRRFNVCCDETWDLGLGQSYELCRRNGKGRVYLQHIRKLSRLARKYGKRIMFWGDIVREHPELIPEIPKDTIVLDWGYGHNHDFGAIREFKRAGLDFYGCPGTSSWMSLFPRLPEAVANIRGFAEAARRNGALGLLNTDWGDGGHYNFMELSWHGYLFGAEQAWNTGADTDSFTARFARLFLRDPSAALARAIDSLGRISQISVEGRYQSVWQHLFFATTDSELFLPRKRTAWVCDEKRIVRRQIVLDARLGRRTLAELRRIRQVFTKTATGSGADQQHVLPYWVFAVDATAHAARKLCVFSKGGTDTPAQRQKLRAEMSALMQRFERIWHARNRPSEIRTTLRRYRKAMVGMIAVTSSVRGP